MNNAEVHHDVPAGCCTKLELYATPTEAYRMWTQGADGVKIIDVRTPEEYAFVGHPEMAMNIPFVMHTYEWAVDFPRCSRHLRTMIRA